MKCSRARAGLSLYVDGQLEMRRLSRLERHLGECAGCRDDLARLLVTQAALREESLAAEPANMTELVMGRVAAHEARRASAAALARQRRAERRRRRAALLQGIKIRRVIALTAALVAVIVWAQVTTPHLLPDLLARVGGGALQLLVTPGPDAIAWSVWAVGAAATLSACAWLARADASEDLRRALVERLPQLW